MSPTHAARASLVLLLLIVPQRSTRADFTPTSDGPLGGQGAIASTSFADFDGDGDLDLFLGGQDADWLLRNVGGATFLNVTNGDLLDPGTTAGASWIDFDGDGDLDLARTRGTGNQVLRNDGGITFVALDLPELGGEFDQFALVWGDYDGDGDPDAYMARNGANRLLRNDDGGIVDVTPPILADPDVAVSADWIDADVDGDIDLYVVNFSGANRLYRNDGAGTFVDVTAPPMDDQGLGTMTAWADVDNDGDDDALLCRAGQPARLFRNDGDMTFVDDTPAGIAALDGPTTAAWADFDNDGDLDLAAIDDGVGIPARLLRNDAGVFVDVTADELSRRGESGEISDESRKPGGGFLLDPLAWADVDGDGNLDLYVSGRTPGNGVLFLNTPPTSLRWLDVSLVGTSSAPLAAGARIAVTTDDDVQTRTLSHGNGRVQNGSPLHVGLSLPRVVDRVEIQWPSGTRQTLTGLLDLGHITIVEAEDPWHDVTAGRLEPDDGGSGAAFGDYDGDGDPDLFLSSEQSPNRLLRNDAGIYADVTAPARLSGVSGSRGAAWGDVDDDGDLDLYVTNAGSFNQLFRNDGGVFVDITSGPEASDAGNAYGATWVDFDLDHDLDLYVEEQNGLLLEQHAPGDFSRVPGEITGSNVRAAAWGDVDDDGDPDAVVVQAAAPVLAVHINVGQDVFDPTPIDTAPVPDDAPGTRELRESLGFDNVVDVALGDIDNDTDLDVIAIGHRGGLFRNDGGNEFVRVPAGDLDSIGVDGLAVTLLDADLDGDLDAFVSSQYTDQLLLNDDGIFTHDPAGEIGGVRGRTAAWGDIDGDGDPDLLAVSRTDQSQRLLENRPAASNHWLSIVLRGETSNRFGIGARITVVDGSRRQVREMTAGSRALSQDESMASFGLGSSTVADSVVVRWPEGTVQILTAVAADQRLELTEPPADWTRTTPGDLAAPVSGASVALADYDDDGDVDAYVGVNDTVGRLYRNDGGAFVDATDGQLVVATNVVDAAWGDVDGDFDLDLFVATDITTLLFENDGGTFVLTPERLAMPGTSTPKAPAAGVSSPAERTAGGGEYESVTWIDIENDGDLDVYVVRDRFPNQWYRNDGGTLVVTESGALANAGPGRDAAWGDYDGDGDLDVYIANLQPDTSVLLRNDGDGEFADVTSLVRRGQPTGTLSATWGDADGDGDLDLYVTKAGFTNELLLNTGGGFIDGTTAVLENDRNAENATWLDADFDGDLDLYLSNREYRNRLVENVNGAFRESFHAALGEPDRESIRAAPSDLDGDGDLDLFVLSYETNQPSALLRNDADRGNWLGVDLRSDVSSTFGVGARISLVVDGKRIVRSMIPHAGRRSSGPLRVWFGLGEATAYDSLRVDWPSGGHELYDIVALNQVVTLTEGGGNVPIVVGAFGARQVGGEILVSWTLGGVDAIADVVLERAVIGSTAGAYEAVDGASFGTAPGAYEFRDHLVKVAPSTELGYRLCGQVRGGERIPLAGPVYVRVGSSTDRAILHQNVPNPFNPVTSVSFDLPRAGHVRLVVHDTAGRRVRTLVESELESGRHTVRWTGRDDAGREVASGTYYVALSAGGRSDARAMRLLR